jgi:hypothetical protein
VISNWIANKTNEKEENFDKNAPLSLSSFTNSSVNSNPYNEEIQFLSKIFGGLPPSPIT